MRIFDGRKTGMVVGKKKKGVEENNYSEKSDCSIVGPTYTLTLGSSKSTKSKSSKGTKERRTVLTEIFFSVQTELVLFCNDRTFFQKFRNIGIF